MLQWLVMHMGCAMQRLVHGHCAPCHIAYVILQAEAAREAEAPVARDGDGEASSSLTVAAAMATEHAEGHGSLQYAAAQSGGADARYRYPCIWSSATVDLPPSCMAYIQ